MASAAQLEIAEDWSAGSFGAQTNLGARRIAGWLNHPFAVDFRVFEDTDGDPASGWQVSHIPTGFRVVNIFADLDTALTLASGLLIAADWDFTDITEAKARGPQVRDFMMAHPEVSRSEIAFGPLMATGK